MTTITDAEKTLLAQLKNPFDPKFVKFRVGATSKDKTKGIALAYLDAREVYKRLDDVCGISGWQTKFIEINGGFICELSIRMPDGTWVTKSDTADSTDIEAIKGGASSALKRAAAVWGIGRYLYYLPNVWVALNQFKQLSDTPNLPDWALPGRVERWEDVAEMELSNKDMVDETDTIQDKKQAIKEKLNASS